MRSTRPGRQGYMQQDNHMTHVSQPTTSGGQADQNACRPPAPHDSRASSTARRRSRGRRVADGSTSIPGRRAHTRARLTPGSCFAARLPGTSGRRRRHGADVACRRASGKLEPKKPAERGQAPLRGQVRPAPAGLQLEQRKLPRASGWGCYEHPPPSTCSAQACCHKSCKCTCLRGPGCGSADT